MPETTEINKQKSPYSAEKKVQNDMTETTVSNCLKKSDSKFYKMRVVHLKIYMAMIIVGLTPLTMMTITGITLETF